MLPLHHPIRVAEQWATLDVLSGGRVDFATGRGYDRREYGPFGANFEENDKVFAEGVEIVTRLWSGGRPDLPSRKVLHVRRRVGSRRCRCKGRSRPRSPRSRSRRSSSPRGSGSALWSRRARPHRCMAGLAKRRSSTARPAPAAGTPPRRLITSYFIHFADDAGRSATARERQLRYHKECTSHAPARRSE